MDGFAAEVSGSLYGAIILARGEWKFDANPITWSEAGSTDEPDNGLSTIL